MRRRLLSALCPSVLFAVGSAFAPVENIRMSAQSRVVQPGPPPMPFATVSASSFSKAPPAQRKPAVSPPGNDAAVAVNRAPRTAQPIDGAAIVQCAGKEDSRALTAAVTAARGGWVVIASGQTCVVSDITIPNLRIEKGGLLKPLTGHTIVLSGNFEAGLYETFTNAFSGQGTVLFLKPPVTGDGQTGVVQVYPQWWGCIPDYTHDCAPAITAAINSGARRIFLPGGGYGVASPITITNNNFVLEGQSRVYTDILPLAPDIHVGAGPNAMFINAQNITNCIIEKIRFTSLIGFKGWAIWAEDGVQGGEALFSSIIQNCWISMGTSAPGFFHGGFSGSTFINNEIENTRTVFDLKGGGISDCLFISNRFSFSVNSFIVSTSTFSNQMVVEGLQVSNHKGGVLLDIRDGHDWQINDVSFNYDPGSVVPGGLVNFDSCTKVILSNFKASRLSGDMSGILIKDSEVKISNGHLFNVNGTTAVQYPITIRGTTNDVDIMGVNVDTSGPPQVYFDTNGGGNIRFSHCKFTKGSSSVFDSGRGITANIDIRDSTIINGQYKAGVSTGRLLQFSTSGRIYIVNNVIGVDDALATPRAVFAFNGSGDALIDGNTFIGTERLPVFAGGSAQVVRIGRNYGFATTFYGTEMPTTGSWKAGDVVMALTPVETGTKGSKYIIAGWIRLTTGSSNVLNTDWMQMRTLTGN